MTLVTTAMAGILLQMSAATSQRTVTVTFVNYLDGRTLLMATPTARQVIGSFQFGGQLTVPIFIPDSSVPVTVRWQAGEFSGTITITDDTADYLVIELTRRGVVGPYAVDEEEE
jgi:hypothetical protein